MQYSRLPGWFILTGVIGVVMSLFTDYRASPSGYHLGLYATALAAADIWIGNALRKGLPLARFLALGCCVLIVIAAWLLPIVLVRAAFANTLASALFGWHAAAVGFDWLIALVATVYVIVSGVICYRGYQDLRSHHGRIEFGAVVGEHGELRHESLGIVAASIIVWVVVGIMAEDSFYVSREKLPRFLMTSAMKTAEDKQSPAHRPNVSVPETGPSPAPVSSRPIEVAARAAPRAPVDVLDPQVLADGDQAIYRNDERVVCPTKSEIVIRDYQILRASGDIDTVYVSSNAGERTFTSRGAALDEGCRLALRSG
jgi:hypothetical protein